MGIGWKLPGKPNTMFYNLHTHKSSDTNHIEIINLQYDCNPDFNNRYSFGIHPWDITTINIATAIERLKQLIAEKKNYFYR